MVGQNVSMILPEPLASRHQMYLERYLESGESVRLSQICVGCFVVGMLVPLRLQLVMDKTRTVFGKHRLGYVFPMVLAVKQNESGFVGVMQRLASEQQFILFYSKSLHIASASEESLSMLGVGLAFHVFW
jgi:hypothetical protein